MRRLISAFFYAAAGLFLLVMAMMVFVAEQPGMSRWQPIAVMAPFVLVPLLLGVLVSPGSRIREIGIVLLASGVVTGLFAAMIAMFMRSPEFRAALPPDSRKGLEMFGDPWLGIAFVGGMILLGLLMLLRGPYRPPRA